MNKTFLRYFMVGTLTLFLVLVPQSASAAELIFKAISNAEIEVYVDPQSKSLNVVEGTIEFSGAASEGLSVQVENGQSILPLWPTPPQYDKNTRSIVFTGGVPNGFDAEGLLFRLRLSPTTPGSLSISYANGSTYLNDGKGTAEPISSRPLKIYVDEGMSSETSEAPSGSNEYKYTIITLLAIITLFTIFKYGLKKPHK
jgi:hypothetical protein